jgi:ankyrin repeat protein
METISAIVQAGGDVNAATSQFGTPLCLAAMRRDLAAVTFLIEHNASVNKKCTMLGSAAHAACAGGDLAVIRALHAAGADWKSPHSVFVSALCHLSRLAQEGDVPLACGSLEYPEYQLQSAGAVAVRFRHCEAVEFCLRLPKGPSVLEVWQFISSSSATYVLGFSYQTRFVGNTMSLLSLAMSTLDIRTAKSLLNHGACDNILDPLGRGALAYALDATRLQGTNAADLDSAVKLLVRHGVDINGLHSPNWQYRHAAKDLLDNWERYYASGELLQCPAVNVYDPLEQAGTALMYTVSRGNKLGSRAHCIEVLLNNGAKIDVRDKKGTSALDLARICLYGEQRIEVERILLRHGTSFAGHNDVRNTWDYY